MQAHLAEYQGRIGHYQPSIELDLRFIPLVLLLKQNVLTLAKSPVEVWFFGTRSNALP